MKKLLFWIFILVCAFGLGFLTFNIFIMPRISGSSQTVKVPNLIGLSITDAQNLILRNNLELGNVRAVFDTLYQVGLVVGQKPLAGSIVRSGRSVQLVVSKGPQIAKVPLLEQMSLEQGLRTLNNLGFRKIVIDSLRSTTIPNGKIIGIEPASGLEIPITTRIKLYISSGETGIFLMPSLVGLATYQAIDTINSNNLILGNLQMIPSDEQEGLVIIQYPEAGMRVRSGDTVRLIVSKGRQ